MLWKYPKEALPIRPLRRVWKSRVRHFDPLNGVMTQEKCCTVLLSECNTRAKNKKKGPRICLNKFPDDEERREAWILAIGSTSFPKDQRLCWSRWALHIAVWCQASVDPKSIWSGKVSHLKELSRTAVWLGRGGWTQVVLRFHRSYLLRTARLHCRNCIHFAQIKL